MQLRNKRTGDIVRVTEGVWDSLRNKGRGHLYEVVNPVAQPEIKSVPKDTRQAYSEFPEAEETPKPKKKKKTKKKQDVEITDLTDTSGGAVTGPFPEDDDSWEIDSRQDDVKTKDK